MTRYGTIAIAIFLALIVAAIAAPAFRPASTGGPTFATSTASVPATVAQTSVARSQTPSASSPPASSQPASPNVADTSEAFSQSQLLAMASDPYYSGVPLPLGDYKYTTAGPKKGYIYLCNVMQGGQGAQTTGPWVDTSAGTWSPSEKVAVEGAVSWPGAYVHISVNGDTRTISSDDLPTVGTTGSFPIAQDDPAHQYDGNPNSIEAQNLTFNLPASPTIAAQPTCIYGEVGIMTNGVLLLDGFDAEYRDAEAHEIQDSCQGHPHEGGVYHYHSLSSCLQNATVTNVIGWAFDGFPITGPEVAPGKFLTTADLDECHGITSTIDIDGKEVTTYHYVMTQDFPYSISCFRGKSYEPGPGGQTQGPSQSQASGGGPQGGPPQAAINACDSGSDGSSCSFSTPNGTVSGTCRTPPGQSQLACVPN